MINKKATYEELCASLDKNTLVIYNDERWVIIKNENGEQTLMPVYCNQNEGKPINVPVGTIFQNIKIMSTAI